MERRSGYAQQVFDCVLYLVVRVCDEVGEKKAMDHQDEAGNHTNKAFAHFDKFRNYTATGHSLNIFLGAG